MTQSVEALVNLCLGRRPINGTLLLLTAEEFTVVTWA
jgi:hypothetical protein